jgi:branched-chain amino acid transport system permease protein
MVFEELFNGIVIGSSYALLALGFTLVWGMIRLINFAQIGLYTLGAYIALLVMPSFERWFKANGWMSFILVLLLSGLLSGIAGVVVAMIAWWPIRHSPVITTLVSSLAVLLLIESLIEVFVSPLPMVVKAPIENRSFSIMNTHISSLQLVILGVSILLTLVLYEFIQYAKTGRAIRAVASNTDSAVVLGINTTFTVVLVFGIAATLAGMAGVLVSNAYGVANFTMGEIIGLKGFTAAVLGGMGNLWGAVVGGYALGILESLATFLLPSQWTPVVAFAVLILVLAFRPTGILPSRSADRA